MLFCFGVQVSQHGMALGHDDDDGDDDGDADDDDEFDDVERRGGRGPEADGAKERRGGRGPRPRHPAAPFFSMRWPSEV